MRYQPINWQDGMKVNKDHFIGMENALREEILERAGRQLSAYDYGLFPQGDGTASLDIYFKIDQSQQIVISLLICRAITAGGVLLDVSPDQQQLDEFRAPLSQLIEKFRQDSDVLYIYLDKQSFERQPVGEPDSLERPERMPYTQATHRLMVGFGDANSSQASRSTQLPLMRIIRKEGTLLPDPQYIPPCTSISAHQTLIKSFGEWQRVLENLVHHAAKTISRIYEITSSGKESLEFQAGQKISLADSVAYMTRDLLNGLSLIVPEFKQILGMQPLIFSLIAIQKLAWRLQTTLSFLNQLELNQLLNYVKESMGMENFLPIIQETIQHAYRHEDAATTVRQINRFLGLLMQLYDEQKGFPVKDFAWRVIKEEEKEDIEIFPHQDKSTLA